MNLDKDFIQIKKEIKSEESQSTNKGKRNKIKKEAENDKKKVNRNAFEEKKTASRLSKDASVHFLPLYH